jgi:hypothetical protein
MSTGGQRPRSWRVRPAHAEERTRLISHKPLHGWPIKRN